MLGATMFVSTAAKKNDKNATTPIQGLSLVLHDSHRQQQKVCGNSKSDGTLEVARSTKVQDHIQDEVELLLQIASTTSTGSSNASESNLLHYRTIPNELDSSIPNLSALLNHRQDDHQQVSIAAPTTTSIVGTRPTHWRRLDNNSSLTSMQTSNKNSSSLHHTKRKRPEQLTRDLAKAVRATTMMPSHNSLFRSTSSVPTIVQDVALSFAPTFVSSSEPHGKKGICHNRQSFIPKANHLEKENSNNPQSSNSSNELDQEFHPPPSVVDIQSSNYFPTSPSKPSSKGPMKKGHGPLVQRLHSLRDNIQCDCIRLQNNICTPNTTTTTTPSTSYWSGSSVMDRNDPRYHVHSYVDVTVVGSFHPWYDMVGDTTPHRFTALAVIHRVWKKHRTTTRKQGMMEDLDGQVSMTSNHNAGDIPVWIIPSNTLLQDRKLTQVGSQVRLYNTVWVPISTKQVGWSLSNTNNMYINDVDSSSTETHPVVVPKYIILCTDLCEPYPSTLPALPVIE